MYVYIYIYIILNFIISYYIEILREIELCDHDSSSEYLTEYRDYFKR